MGRERLIVAIEAVHALLFLVLAAGALYVLVCGVTGRRGRWLWIALGGCALELAVLVVFNWRCPLTTLAEWLGARSGSVADLFLPAWTMPYVFPVFGGILALGALLVAVRSFARR
ncbi:MAG: hypothetical protein JST54_00790 [Deltaproteobacteria bacterium]|nr:hypothetical protein [Deltaproteobacteria bacterium]